MYCRYVALSSSLTYLSAPDSNTDVSMTVSLDDDVATPLTASTTLNITPVNDVPVINGVPQSDLKVGETYSFVPVASDVDGDVLQFSVQSSATLG